MQSRAMEFTESTRADAAISGAATSAGAALELRDVSYSYGSVQVLFDVSFTVPRGDVVALLGSNGAGKSTILQLIAGALRPTRGTVLVGGDDVTDGDVRTRVRRGTVLVPEVRAVFPELTVAENLEVGAFSLRKDRRLRAERMNEIYEMFPRLAERRFQDASTLSGGERQMLSLAKAFQLHPATLLIDELSLGLAPTMVDLLVDAVAAFKARGTSILVVEQSVNVAAALADHAVVVERGAVRHVGPMTELRDNPRLMQAVLLGGHIGEEV